MGGLPLLGPIAPGNLVKTFWPPDPDPPAPAAPPAPAPLGAELRLPSRKSPAVSRARNGDDDVVGRLERLAALRDRGAIDADEYERAKKAVLDG